MAADAGAPGEGRQEHASTSGRDAGITYRQFKDEHDLPVVTALIEASLSEPYSVFTYRYFLAQWPGLCWLAYDGPTPVGVVVAKMDDHRGRRRGYIAMLVVDDAHRGRGLGRALAKRAIAEMVAGDADEVVLEAEVANSGALALYRSLGFLRDKHLHRYYLNSQDAYRLKLLLPLSEEAAARLAAEQEQADALLALSGAPAIA
ncbi:MAK3 [Scenedesmus sp. PABB004]|nr:MAK3 [Scenedesmus sp. PABB004]